MNSMSGSAGMPSPPRRRCRLTSLAGRGRYQVESYLDHQGNKLVRRFDANSYIAMTEALMSHDVMPRPGDA